MSVPLYTKIYLDIKEKILSKEFQPGDQLPSEIALAEKYGVSKITTKKAMDLLSQEGLLYRQKGKGTFITENSTILLGEVKQEEIQRTKIGLIVSDFHTHTRLNMIKSIEKALQDKAELVFGISDNDVEKEKKLISLFINDKVDGIIILPTNSQFLNPELVQLVINNFPIVFIDLNINLSDQHSVSTDNTQAVYDCLDYITDNHSEIAIIHSSSMDNVNQERIMAVKNYCTENSIIIPQNYWLDDIDQAWDKPKKEYLEKITLFLNNHQNLETIFAFSYEIAETTRIAAEQMGKKVGEDLSIICFDSPDSMFEPPFFTHIKQDEQTIGQDAATMILDLTQQKLIKEKNIKVKATLVKGRSFKEKR